MTHTITLRIVKSYFLFKNFIHADNQPNTVDPLGP